MDYNFGEIGFLIENYNPKNPNAAEAARKFREKFGRTPSNRYVNNIWKSLGFSVGKRGGRRYGLSDEEAIKYHAKYGGNPSAASEEAGYKSGSIRKRWISLGLD